MGGTTLTEDLGLSFLCPACTNRLEKVANEYVNFHCKKCLKKWTIVDLDAVPRDLIEKMISNQEFYDKVISFGKDFERSSL